MTSLNATSGFEPGRRARTDRVAGAGLDRSVRQPDRLQLDREGEPDDRVRSDCRHDDGAPPGPETRATTLSCPRDAEYFGAEFRLGTYLPMFPPAQLANLQDVVLPTLPDGRILLDNRAWEVPTPQNIDVFIDRLERAGLLVFDPLAVRAGSGQFLAL